MRRPLAVPPILAVALLVSACGASQSPNWTFAPPTAAPTAGPSQAGSGAPSGAQSAAPSAGPSTAPSAASSAAPSAGGSGAGSAAPSAAPSAAAGGGAAVVNITALNVDFTTKTVSAPANAPFTIHFDNQDPSTPHDVVIKDGSGMTTFSGELVTGPVQTDYKVPALAAGTYTFVCSVHANMTGTLTVGP